MRVPTRARDASRPNDSMTPLIDVVFLLLIFFVCASVGQVAESMLPTELDQGAVATMEAVVKPDEPVTSKVWVYMKRQDAQLSLKLESRECATFAELADGLRLLGDLSPESPVILDIGPQVPLEAVVDAWDVCNRAGFQSINFATKSAEKQPPPQ